jgi:hypothetical protein
LCDEPSFTSITAPTCRAPIISLEPCALNADFQHFIPMKIPYFTDTPERRLWGERRPKRKVTLQYLHLYIQLLTLTHTTLVESLFLLCVIGD